jgi:hypothetical protein
MGYCADAVKGGVDLCVEEVDAVDELLFEGGLFGLLEEGEDVVVVALDERVLVVVEDGDVGLEGLHDFSEEAVVLQDVLLQLAVDALETGPVVPLGLPLQLHDAVDGVDQPVLELARRFYALDLLVQQRSLHPLNRIAAPG